MSSYKDLPVIGGGGGGADFPHNTDIVDMTGGTGAVVIDVANLKLQSGGVTTVDWALQRLENAGTESLDWGSGELINSSLQPTLNWMAQTLHSSGNLVADWSTQHLITNGGQLSIDWNAFQLISPSNQPVVDWNNLYLRDSSSGLSLDWGGRRLSNESGTQTVEYGNGSYQLNDSSGNTSVDWGGRNLVSNGSVSTVQWNNLVLQDNSGNGSLSWGSREAIDGSNLTSIDYGGRTLKDGGTQVALDWAGRNLNNSSAATILTWSSAVQLAAGTVAAPNLVFAADTTYGWYQPSAGVWSFSSNNAQRFSLGNGQQNFTLNDQSVAGAKLICSYGSGAFFFEHSNTASNSSYNFLSLDSTTTSITVGSEVTNGTSWGWYTGQPSSGDDIGGMRFKNLNGGGASPFVINKNNLTGIGVGDGNRNNLNVLTVWGVPDITATGTTTVNASAAVTVTSGKLLQQAGVGDLVAVSSAPTVFVPITAIASNTAMTVKTAIGNGSSQTLVIKKAIVRGDNSSNVPAFLVDANGEISTQIAGSGLSIKTGSNARMGQATLASGTVTVSTTAVLTGSFVFLTDASGGANIGSLAVGTITNATSFVINSTNVLDSSKVNWIIINPA